MCYGYLVLWWLSGPSTNVESFDRLEAIRNHTFSLQLGDCFANFAPHAAFIHLTEESILLFLFTFVNQLKWGERHHFKQLYVLVLRVELILEVVNCVLSLLLLYVREGLEIIWFFCWHGVDHLVCFGRLVAGNIGLEAGICVGGLNWIHFKEHN